VRAEVVGVVRGMCGRQLVNAGGKRPVVNVLVVCGRDVSEVAQIREVTKHRPHNSQTNRDVSRNSGKQHQEGEKTMRRHHNLLK
jgi:hypothetical protein